MVDFKQSFCNYMSKTSISNGEIWRIGYPIMAGMLSQTLINLVDTAFLGRLGETELGAASMAGIYYYVFTTLTWGFAIGVQIIVARRFGEKNYEQISVVVRHGLVLALVLAMAIFALFTSTTSSIMHTFVESQGVSRVAVEFIDYRKFGIFFASINFLIRSFYIGISTTRPIVYSTLLMTLVNIVLNSMLIFGSPFNAPMGVAGAAIASVAAEFSALIFFVSYTFIKKPLGVKLFAKFRWEWKLIASIARLSISTIGQKMISYGSWLAFFLLIEKLGERALAVTMVCRSILQLICIPVFSFSTTANALTSRILGEGKRDEVMPTAAKILRMSFICLTPLSLMVLLFPEQCLMIYTSNVGIIQDAVPILLMGVGYQYCMSLGMIYFDTVSGTGNTGHALGLEVIVLVFYLFIAWLFTIAIPMDVFWVWTAEVAYGVLLFVLSFVYLKRYSWWRTKV